MTYSNDGSDQASWLRVTSLPISENLSDLVSYLRQQHIPIHITEEEGQQVLWVREQAHVPLLQETLEKLRSGNIHLEKTVRDKPSSSSVGPLYLVFNKFPITCVLLVGSLIGGLATQFESMVFVYYWLSFVDFFRPQDYQTIPDVILQSELWRLVTPMFIHSGWSHLIFNAVMLWFFGTRIETVIGRLHFIIMVLMISTCANVGQYLWEQDPRFGGMSGVNYGLLGYVWIRHYFSSHGLLILPKGMVTLLIGWLLLGLFGVLNMLLDVRIANGAHVAGLLGGMLWGAVHGWYLSLKK